MDQRRMFERCQRLQRRGVPEAFIGEIAHRQNSLGLPAWLIIPALLVSFVAVMFGAGFTVEYYALFKVQRLGAAFGGATGTWWALPGILALYAGVVALAAAILGLFYGPGRPYPAPCLGASMLRSVGMDGAGNAIASFIFVRTTGGVSGAQSPDDFLRQYARSAFLRPLKVAVVLILLGLAIIAGTAKQWAVYPQGLTEYSAFGQVNHPWSEAMMISMECGGNANNPQLRYSVMLGLQTFKLADLTTMHSPRTVAERIEGLEKVDAVMRSQLTSRMNQSFDVTPCANRFGATLPNGPARVARLMEGMTANLPGLF